MKYSFCFPYVIILTLFISRPFFSQNKNSESEINYLNKTTENTVAKDYYDPANEIDIDLMYDSHDQYRGRDNGIIENGLATSVQYQHRSGFGAFIDAKYLSKSKKAIDDYDLGLSWLFDISRVFNIYLSYSHFWYTDSVQVRADLNNSLESVFNLETKNFNSSFTLDLDFGGGIKEFTSTLYSGFPFIISRKLFKGTLTIEPGASVILGEQDLTLVARRKNRRGRFVPVLKKSSTFGAMDYEIHLPLTLETKHLIVKPQFDLIIPVNVLDLSTKSAFGNFELEITIPFKF